MQTRASNPSFFQAPRKSVITTDASVFPSPEGDTSVRRMAIEAREMGFDSIVAIGHKSWRDDTIRVIGGTIIREQKAREVINATRSGPDTHELVIVNAGNNSFNRSILQMKGVHIIRHLHKAEKNAFDHIIARMSFENNVAIDIDIRPIIMSRGPWRQKTIQRYKDIIALQRRFEFPLTLSSNARSLLEFRSAREIINLAGILGLEESEAKYALGNVGRLLEPEKLVEVVR